MPATAESREPGEIPRLVDATAWSSANGSPPTAAHPPVRGPQVGSVAGRHQHVRPRPRPSARPPYCSATGSARLSTRTPRTRSRQAANAAKSWSANQHLRPPHDPRPGRRVGLRFQEEAAPPRIRRRCTAATEPASTQLGFFQPEARLGATAPPGRREVRGRGAATPPVMAHRIREIGPTPSVCRIVNDPAEAADAAAARNDEEPGTHAPPGAWGSAAPRGPCARARGDLEEFYASRACPRWSPGRRKTISWDEAIRRECAVRT